MKENVIASLDQAVEFFNRTFAAYPERDAMKAARYARLGIRRKYPVMRIGHLNDPDDRSEPAPGFVIPKVTTGEDEIGALAREVVNLLKPLELDNPIRPSFGLGRGTGTLVTLFGVPLNVDADNTPAYTRPIAEILKDPFPDVANGGLMPEMFRRIDFLKRNLPANFKIRLPDLQGPFNLVHALAGTDALMAPYAEPDEFHVLMDRVTDVWIGARQLLIDTIGEARFDDNCSKRICECSVNLMSADMYIEHVLPYDKKIQDAIGKLHIHPCSGPHVFKATLDNLDAFKTEAGYIEQTAAGAILPEDALNQIDGRPVVLAVGQELPKDFFDAFEFVKKDFDRYEKHPWMTFDYTGMFWKKSDQPKIRELHAELDRYWQEKYPDGEWE